MLADPVSGSPVEVDLPSRPGIFSNHMNGLGDLVLLAPLLRTMKVRLEAEITILVWPFLAEYAHALPFVDRVIVWEEDYSTDEGREAFLASLSRDGPWDLSLDFAFPPKSSPIAMATGAPIRIACRPDPEDAEAATIHFRRTHGRPLYLEYLSIATDLGIAPVPIPRHADLILDASAVRKAKMILDGAGISDGDLLVAIHPFAGNPSRRWSAGAFAETADRIADEFGAKVLFLGGSCRKTGDITRGEEDAAILDEILDRSSHPHPATRGADTLAVLPFLLRGADLFVGNNSGPMHLAGSLGTRTAAVWGASDPREWRPIGKDDDIVMVSDYAGLDCAPCAPSGCGDPICIRRPTPDHLMDAIRDRWGGIERRGLEIAPFAEIGSGERPVPGHIHIDRRALPGLDLMGDAANLPILPGSLLRLHAQHIIEHIPPSMTVKVLSDWRESLSEGGSLLIVTPNLDYITRGHDEGSMTTAEAVHRLYGGQEDEGNIHRTIFDPEGLMGVLGEAGFSEVFDITRRFEDRLVPMSIYMIAFR